MKNHLYNNGTHRPKGGTKTHFFKDPTDHHWRYIDDGRQPYGKEVLDWVNSRNVATDPDVIIRWTDIRDALPDRAGKCLVRRQLGLGGYGNVIIDAWFDGQKFVQHWPGGRELTMLDYTDELWGDADGVIGWAYVYRAYLNGGGWQDRTKQTWKDRKGEE